MAAKKKSRKSPIKKAKAKVKAKVKAKAKVVAKVKKKAKAKVKAKAKKTTAKAVRFTDSAVFKKTGKTLTQWFTVLDEAGARAMANADIATLLKARHQVADWASQGLAATYAQTRGLKKLQKSAQKTAKKAVASVGRTLFDAIDKVEDLVTKKK